MKAKQAVSKARKTGRRRPKDVSKIAISLPKEQIAFVKRAVKAGAAPSVSAYVAEALAERAKEDSLEILIAKMQTEVGEPTEALYRAVDEALGLKV